MVCPELLFIEGVIGSDSVDAESADELGDVDFCWFLVLTGGLGGGQSGCVAQGHHRA